MNQQIVSYFSASTSTLPVTFIFVLPSSSTGLVPNHFVGSVLREVCDDNEKGRGESNAAGDLKKRN